MNRRNLVVDDSEQDKSGQEEHKKTKNWKMTDLERNI